MDRDIVHVQERQGSSFATFAFELTYQEFHKGVKERAEPDSTMICGAFGLGDMLMLTPMLRGLKELLPENPVHLFCGPKEYCVLENNPHIDLLIAVPHRFQRPSVKRAYIHLCALYCRAYCLCGIINGNQKAELINAYEVIANKIGVRPRSYIPDYYSTPAELELARQTLESVGIMPKKDRIAVIQPCSSSPMRTLPYETTEDLVCYLENSGWRTIVLWDRKNLPTKASHFGHWTSRDFPDLALRDLFAMVSFADIVIATDSVISHLAAALDIPSVLLYGPFLPELRSSHFPRAYSLQAEVPCGPCFQHGKYCPIEGKGIPSCMRSFSIESITEAVNAVLSPDYSPTSKKFPRLTTELKEIKCRMCDCKEMAYYTRQKDIIYFKCIKCGTVQTNVSSDECSLFATPPHQYFSRLDPKSQKRAAKALMALLPTVRKLVDDNGHSPLLLDFGSGEALASIISKAMDCEIEVFEPDLLSTQELVNRRSRHWTNWEQVTRARKNKYDVITMLDSMQYLQALDVVFPQITSCLNANGWLLLTLFCVDDINAMPPAFVIRTRDSGGPPLIVSKAGLDAFTARFGFKRVWDSKIPNWTSRIFLYQKE